MRRNSEFRGNSGDNTKLRLNLSILPYQQVNNIHPTHENNNLVRCARKCGSDYDLGLMNNTSPRSIQPFLRSTRNHPLLFFL